MAEVRSDVPEAAEGHQSEPPEEGAAVLGLEHSHRLVPIAAAVIAAHDAVAPELGKRDERHAAQRRPDDALDGQGVGLEEGEELAKVQLDLRKVVPAAEERMIQARGERKLAAAPRGEDVVPVVPFALEPES